MQGSQQQYLLAWEVDKKTLPYTFESKYLCTYPKEWDITDIDLFHENHYINISVSVASLTKLTVLLAGSLSV